MSDQKLQNLSICAKEDSNIAVALAQPSDYTDALYNPLMRKVGLLAEEEIQRRLNKFGIWLDRNQFCHKFMKSCIRTDWQSTTYEIKHGYLKTEIRIISVDLHSSSLCDRSFNRGGFGQVLKFDILGERGRETQYVLKNVKCKGNGLESMDCAFQEVFMAKVFSALEAGPKFYQLFSYDAIVFRNCIQFAMELCRTEYETSQINQQVRQRNLLLLLKLIHHLRICHMDIKKENIGWSPAFNKLIFLDFTFTNFLEESIGFKTRTGFVGTYQYSSPQMKKRFQLQDRSFVDLYFNDLHCLNQTWKQLALMDQNKAKFLKYLNKKQEHQRMEKKENVGIVAYFNLKFSIYEGQVQKINQLFQKERVLKWTFRKIWQKYQKTTIYQTSSNLNTNYSSVQMSFDHLMKIDKILYSYQIKTEVSPLVVHFSQVVEEISDSEKLFKQAWQKQKYKESMFFFIDFYSNPSQEGSICRKNLIDKISAEIEFQAKKSDLMKFRGIMCYYMSYFQEKQNLEALEKIMTYFVLMEDHFNRRRAQIIILSILERKENYLEFDQRNFKYFLGYLATFNHRNTWQGDRYIQNSQRLALTINQKPTCKQILEIILQSIKNMKLLKVIILNQLKEPILGKVLKFLKFPNKEQNQQIQKFIQSILSQNLQGAQTETIRYKDHYLEKCSFMMHVLQKNYKQKLFSLKQLLQSQIFTRNFATRTRLHILRLSVDEERSIRRAISEDFCEICQEEEKGKEENGKVVFRLEFLQALNEIGGVRCVEEYVLSYFRELPLSDIDDFEKLQNLNSTILILLVIFINFKSNDCQRISQQSKQKLEAILLPFLQFTSNLANLPQALSQQPPIKQIAIETTNNLTLNQISQKFLLFLLTKKQQQALKILTNLVNQSQNNNSLVTLFHYICLFFENAEKELKCCVTDAIVRIGEKMGKFQLQSFFYVPVFIQALLDAYRRNGMIGKCFDFVRVACLEIQSNRIHYLRGNFFIKISQFLTTCSYEDRNWFIESTINQTLSQLSRYRILTYFIFMAYFYQTPSSVPTSHDNVGAIEIEVKQKVTRRLIVTCVLFSGIFTLGYFSYYKFCLYYQNMVLKCKKPGLREIRKFLSERNLKDFINRLGNVRKGKGRRLLNNDTVEIMKQLTKMKAKLYFNNITEELPTRAL